VPHPPRTNRSRGPKTIKVDPEHILDAAQKVFAQFGINGANIRAIAREAECDPALIYYHFKNKEAMFASVLDRKFPILTKDIQQLADPSDPRHTAERLWDVLKIYRRLLAEDAGFRAIIRGELALGTEGSKDAIALRVIPVLTALSSLIQQGVVRGHLRADLNPFLGTLFLVRPYIDFLDIVPTMSQRILGIPSATALSTVEYCWFELYWRGVAMHPEETLPFLNNLKESHP
jgi:AcrR family transcriptional regulator